MSKTKGTEEHTSHEPKNHGCCGGDHAKAQKAKSAEKEEDIPSDDRKHEHAPLSGGDSGCCGGGKANK
jgi:hypothetical protein